MTAQRQCMCLVRWEKKRFMFDGNHKKQEQKEREITSMKSLQNHLNLV